MKDDIKINVISNEFIDALTKTIDKFEMYYKIEDIESCKIGEKWDRVSKECSYEPLYLISIQKNNKVDVYLTYEESRGGLNNLIPLLLITKKKGIFKSSLVLYISTNIFKKFDMVKTDKIKSEITELNVISNSIIKSFMFTTSGYLNDKFRKDKKY